MGRRRLATVVLAATAIAVCGCGSSGSKSLTRAELIAKADAICKGISTQLNAQGRKATPAQQVFSQVAAYEQTALAELKKLNPPSDMAGDWKQIVAGAQTLTEDTTKYAEYSKSKDLSKAQSLAVSGAAVRQQVSVTARRAGFNDCAQAL
jgi:hypothetical protein